MDPLYCPYCGEPFEGKDYQSKKVKVHNHIRNSCKKKVKS